MSFIEVEKSLSAEETKNAPYMKTKHDTHVICLGNEKGGSGKSTTAMHIVVALLKMGATVGVIDLDCRQQSMARYLENRKRWASEHNQDLEMPEVRTGIRSVLDARSEAEAEEKAHFNKIMEELSATCDFIVIDAPGNDTFMSRLGHASADTVITPMNDSYVDLDLLADVDPVTNDILGTSLYSQMIWESRKKRAIEDRASIDWVIMRNRLSSIKAKNKWRVGEALEKLAPRTGFRLAPGFGERVIYRELFPKGLTLLDLGGKGSEGQLTMSHVAARQELRDLMLTLKLPGLDGKEADI